VPKPVQVYEQLSKLFLISTPLTFNTNTIESLQNTGDIGLNTHHFTAEKGVFYLPLELI
jgi:hypothetical protein